MKRFLLLAAIAAVAAPAVISLGKGKADTEPPAWLQGEGTLKGYQAARIFTGADQIHDDAILLVRNGKVAGVVSNEEAPPLIDVVDLGDSTIVPGFVAADSPLTGNGNQGDLSMGAHRRAFDDFDPFLDMDKVLERGVTTFYLSPDRRRLVGGRGAVVKSAGENRVLKEESDLRISLLASAFNPPTYFRPPVPPTSENPIVPATPQAPQSRAGALLALRESAAQAKWGVTDVHSHALANFLKSKGTLRIAAEQGAQIRSALSLAQDWDSPLILDGAQESKDWANEIAHSRANVIFHPPLFSSLPDLGPNWEPPAPDALRVLLDAGIPVSLSPGIYGRWTWLLESAAASMAYGMTESEALAGITSRAAHALGVGHRVGSLSPGFDADFLVLEGNPLDPAASVNRVFIDGEVVWDRKENKKERADADEKAAADVPVVLRGGTLWSGKDAPLTGGVEVLLKNGRIVAAGKTVPHPAGARIIDGGSNAHLTPGFIDARSTHSVGRTFDVKAVLGLLASGSRYDESWRELARKGVTTAVIGPSSISKTGVLATAVKTSAGGDSDSYVAESQAVLVDVRTNNHHDLASAIQDTLKSGKDYFARWEKYRADRAKWVEGQAVKVEEERAASEAELRTRLAKGIAAVAAKKEEAKGEDVAEEEQEDEGVKEIDPLNGLWEGTIEDERLPEVVEVNARLFHTGSEVKGIFSSPMAPGETAELDGTWNAESKIVHFEISEDFGTIVMDGTIDADDHMIVEVELVGMASASFELIRIEIDEGPVKIDRKRKKKDEGPQPPSKDRRFEGMRALYEGRAVAMVLADTAIQIRTVAEAFIEAKLPLQIVGGAEAAQVVKLLRQHNIGVVVPSSLVLRKDGVDYVPAAELAELGLSVAFQSGSTSRRASMLPRALAMASRLGLGSEQILNGLTYDAAQMLGIDHRVGSLTPGLDGDVVMHDGPPFDLKTRITHVFVNGVEVSQK